MIEIKTADKTNVPLIQQLAYNIWSVAYKDILSKEDKFRAEYFSVFYGNSCLEI